MNKLDSCSSEALSDTVARCCNSSVLPQGTTQFEGVGAGAGAAGYSGLWLACLYHSDPKRILKSSQAWRRRRSTIQAISTLAQPPV